MKIVLSVAALLVSGCAAQGPVYSSNNAYYEDKSLIYVYRQCSFVGAAAKLHLQLNGSEIQGLRNCGYIFFSVDPGANKVQMVNKGFQSWGAPEPVVELYTQPGQKYFIRYSATAKFIPSGAGGVIPVGAVHFGEVDADVAMTEIHDLRLSNEY